VTISTAPTLRLGTTLIFGDYDECGVLQGMVLADGVPSNWRWYFEAHEVVFLQQFLVRLLEWDEAKG